ncbi:MAG: hypothetical protein IJ736_11900 [Firmicutes bacterium]|nr:hypothetical protein [Bacillota bacterium]
MKKSFKDYLKLGITAAVTAVMCLAACSSVFAASITYSNNATVFDLSAGGTSVYYTDSNFKWRGAQQPPTSNSDSTGIYNEAGTEYKPNIKLKFSGSATTSTGDNSVYFKVDTPSRLIYRLESASTGDGTETFNLYNASLTSSYNWTLSNPSPLVTLSYKEAKSGVLNITQAGEYAIGLSATGSYYVQVLALDPIDSSTPTPNITSATYSSKNFGTASTSAETYATYPVLSGSGTNYTVKLNRNFKEGCVVSEVGVILGDKNASYGKGYNLKYYKKSGTDASGTYDFAVQTLNAPGKIQAYVTYTLSGDDITPKTQTKTVYSTIITQN